MKLHCIRHAQSVANQQGVISCVFPGAEVSEVGTSQIQELSQTSLPWDKDISIISSPFLRTLQTAQGICNQDRLLVDFRIQELDLGSFHGQKYDDVKQEIKDQLAQGAAGNLEVRFGGDGETQRTYLGRVYLFLHDVILDNQDVVVVTHECIVSTIHQFHRELYGGEPTKVTNCSILSLEFQLEDLEHLKKNLERVSL